MGKENLHKYVTQTKILNKHTKGNIFKKKYKTRKHKTKTHTIKRFFKKGNIA
jgi:hypothetical protein